MKQLFRVVGLAVLSVLIATSIPSTRAAAQAGIGGFTFGKRNDLGPRYEFYPERLWEDYKRTGTCRPLTVRERLPNGRVVTRKVPLNPEACGFNTLRD